ncbi:MAG: TIGR01212 family radical SAM protein [Deltaproteobacteria bacterium]|nr:TIGR01212 family radical SAM protein [Deltaproteobacteria bacterium]
MKRYRDYNSYLREIFGERVQKIAIDAGLGCPNRDGKISDRGCIFCDKRGSGTGAMVERGLSIDQQIKEGIEFAKKRYGARKFIAYFQSFTNTYGPVIKLRQLYDQALRYDGMVGLSIGTRPDCADESVLRLIGSYKDDYLVWVEFGLQSAHEPTLAAIGRGHNVACFERSVTKSHELGINTCAHVILGLPGETHEMMMETARYVSGLPLTGIKIHLLYVSKGTTIATMYKNGKVRCLQREEFVEAVVDFLEILPPDMVIQRLTGDPPLKSELLAPEYALDKAGNLKLIKKRLEERDTWQGKTFLKRSFAGVSLLKD